MHFLTAFAIITLGNTALADFPFNVTLYSDFNCTSEIMSVNVTFNEDANCANLPNTSIPIRSMTNPWGYPDVPVIFTSPDCHGGEIIPPNMNAECLNGSQNKSLSLRSTGYGSV